jgi:glucitol operon activator protein
VDGLKYGLVLFVVISLTTISAFAQHKYYARTVRRMVRSHNQPGCVLVSGRAKSRLRGAIAVLVLRTPDGVIESATVMEGSSVLARFKDRPEWIGRPATGPLPNCSSRQAAAVKDACSRVPGGLRTRVRRGDRPAHRE